MSRWIVYASTLLVVALQFASCAKQPAPSTAKLPAPPVLRQEARLHLPSGPSTLDSARAADQAAFDLLGTLMEGLVRPRGKGVVEPAVAERWESPDGRHFTFHLRKEARWSDGSQVTANDFAHAWLRVLDPQSGSDYAFLLYDIEGAEAYNSLNPRDPDFASRKGEFMRQVKIAAPDPTTLEVTLRTTNPQWVNYTLHPVFYPQSTAVMAREGERYGAPEAGFVSNGPYMLERWAQGEEIALRKNPDYWDAGVVRLERVTFRIEGDGQTALRLYEVGLLDQVMLPGELAVSQRGTERMAQPSTMGLVFNFARGPLGNPNLRRALHLTIDRKRLVDEVAPFNAVASEGMVPPSLAGGWRPAAALRIPPQGNHQQARQLWEAARNDLKIDGLALRLLHTPETEPIAQALRSMVQEHLENLTVELESVPFEQRLERARLGQFDMMLQGWAADHDDPITLLELFVTDGPGNDVRWTNPAYDRLIVKTRLGEVERLSGLAEAEQMLLEELPVLPLYHPIRQWMTRGRLKGLQAAPLGARLNLRGAYIEQ